jgi:DNA-binding Lrp family transcriptional regulator
MAGRREQGSRAPLDDVDRRIIELLRADGRLSVNEVARRAGISRATAYTRFDRLVADRVITGFQAVVDPAAMGVPIAALVFVNVVQGNWPAAQEGMLRLPGVDWLALAGGTWDMVLRVRVPDIEHLRDVVLVQLHGMPEVQSTQTVFLLDEQTPPSVSR